MGLDGGTVISRSDVLRGASWALSQADVTRSTRGGAVTPSGVYKRPQLDKIDRRRLQWTSCALSGEPLAAPIVADWLGSLYNKSAVLEFLLARAGSFEDEGAVHRYANQLRAGEGAFDHITSLRDTFEVRMEVMAQPDEGSAPSATPLTCPVTEASCLHQSFCALPRCGHIFSTKALAHMDGTCALCSKAFDPVLVVGLVGEEGERERLRALLPLRPGQTRHGKRKRAPREQG